MEGLTGHVQYQPLSQFLPNHPSEGTDGAEGPSHSKPKTHGEKWCDRKDLPAVSFHRKARRAAGEFPAKEPNCQMSGMGTVSKNAAAPCWGHRNKRIMLWSGSGSESAFSSSVQDSMACPWYHKIELATMFLFSMLWIMSLSDLDKMAMGFHPILIPSEHVKKGNDEILTGCQGHLLHRNFEPRRMVQLLEEWALLKESTVVLLHKQCKMGKSWRNLLQTSYCSENQQYFCSHHPPASLLI